MYIIFVDRPFPLNSTNIQLCIIDAKGQRHFMHDEKLILRHVVSSLNININAVHLEEISCVPWRRKKPKFAK